MNVVGGFGSSYRKLSHIICPSFANGQVRFLITVLRGECGILVSPDNPGEICDAVVNLFKNASLREKLVRNAALRLEKHYAWK
jgi:glycosyltransferase involved in cell wall biosynthesis